MLAQNIIFSTFMLMLVGVASAASTQAIGAVPSPSAGSPAAYPPVVVLKRGWLGKVPSSVWDQMPVQRVEAMMTFD